MSDFTYFFQFTPFGKSVSDQWDNLTSEIQYIAVVCQLIVFPFYVYVHKANNIRDREVVVFQITNHFYKCVVAMNIGYVLFGIFVLCTLAEGLLIYISLIIFPIGIVYVFIEMIIADVFHLLISLLAMEKFFIYFFPRWEKTVISIQKYIHKYIVFVYLACCSRYMLSAVIGSSLEPYGWKFLGPIVQHFLTIILFISVLLYIPVIISVRKLSHLQSAQLSNPQQYIMGQIIVVFFFKILMFIPDSVHIFLKEGTLHSVLMVSTNDSTTIPLIAQLSYLGCNKRNLSLLFNIFSFKVFSKIFMFFGVQRVQQTSTVRPQNLESTVYPL
ncbi:Serpentine Receptor, class Z [Caenorhabditis elegans]|uniref:Serpentine Receptor, class Z n=1 Tax=Caenorhabditis elegans TaxID=6239 RepID=O45642_CAEEL|nr:Serpentine Receptor, class Z [Caenorhabditis elegans]CAB05241.3 Serpentine Receptor, class Z [Caenorhabditis elegans]|eukprot:NP_502942.2 Serpentine Receptor, class Z [Caenorhabditis elegans]